jgi:hypothetical protein
MVVLRVRFLVAFTSWGSGSVFFCPFAYKASGLVGSLKLFPFQLCLPSTSVVILEFWIGNLGIFGIFLSEEENG